MKGIKSHSKAWPVVLRKEYLVFLSGKSPMLNKMDMRSDKEAKLKMVCVILIALLQALH